MSAFSLKGMVSMIASPLVGQRIGFVGDEVRHMSVDGRLRST
jgi:hypothetical protein